MKVQGGRGVITISILALWINKSCLLLEFSGTNSISAEMTTIVTQETIFTDLFVALFYLF